MATLTQRRLDFTQAPLTDNFCHDTDADLLGGICPNIEANRRVDALEQVSVRRYRWVNNCDRSSFLDTETARRLVESSHFLSARSLDFLVRTDREVLARRAHVAEP